MAAVAARMSPINCARCSSPTTRAGSRASSRVSRHTKTASADTDSTPAISSSRAMSLTASNYIGSVLGRLARRVRRGVRRPSNC